MNRVFSTIIIAFLAYKLGEQYTQINSYDYFINRIYIDGVGVQHLEYVILTNSGELLYTPTSANATLFDFWTAKKVRNLLKVHAPLIPINIEIVNPILIN